MKLEVGMYVKTIFGEIGKIEKYCGTNSCGDLWKLDIKENAYNYKNIINSSFNIIDLIEVGDIIKYHPMQNGYVKTNILYKAMKDGRDLTVLHYDVFHEKKKILSIVTKEQFESMEYKI